MISHEMKYEYFIDVSMKKITYNYFIKLFFINNIKKVKVEKLKKWKVINNKWFHMKRNTNILLML